MSNTITSPPRPVMGEDARTRYTAALSARAVRQHGPLRVATVGEAKAAAALAHRYGWTVTPDVEATDALAVALPASTLGGAADTAVRTALRRGLPILIQIGGDLAAFPDCWAVGVPSGYRLRVPAEPGPATTATLTYLGITPAPTRPAPKRAAGPGRCRRRRFDATLRAHRSMKSLRLPPRLWRSWQSRDLTLSLNQRRGSCGPRVGRDGGDGGVGGPLTDLVRYGAPL